MAEKKPEEKKTEEAQKKPEEKKTEEAQKKPETSLPDRAAALNKDVSADSDSQLTDTRKALKAQKTIPISISSTEQDTEPVVVRINGYGYQIMRDVVVEVPESVVKVLNDAVYTLYKQIKTADGIVYEPHTAKRIPFHKEG